MNGRESTACAIIAHVSASVRGVGIYAPKVPIPLEGKVPTSSGGPDLRSPILRGKGGRAPLVRPFRGFPRPETPCSYPAYPYQVAAGAAAPVAPSFCGGGGVVPDCVGLGGRGGLPSMMSFN